MYRSYSRVSEVNVFNFQCSCCFACHLTVNVATVKFPRHLNLTLTQIVVLVDICTFSSAQTRNINHIPININHLIPKISHISVCFDIFVFVTS